MIPELSVKGQSEAHHVKGMDNEGVEQRQGSPRQRKSINKPTEASIGKMGEGNYI